MRVALMILSLCLLLLAATAHAQEAEGSADARAQEVERGPVRVSLVVQPAEPVIGDVIELILETTSEAGVEVLMPEFGEALGRFEIVDFAPSEKLTATGESVSRQRYRLQPPRSGPLSIPPLRVEFVDRRDGQQPAPAGEDAYEVLTERVRVDVKPILAADAPLDLEPAHPDLGPRRTGLLPAWGWAVVTLVALAGIAPFAWRSYQAFTARRRQRSAYEVARGALDELLAQGRPDADAMDAFYVALTLIVRSYLEDRFGLRSPELTTQEFLTEMGRSPDLARSHQQLLRDFLTQADLVKFAGLRPDAEAVGQSIAGAERFLEETRDQVRSETLGGQPDGQSDEGARHA